MRLLLLVTVAAVFIIGCASAPKAPEAPSASRIEEENVDVRGLQSSLHMEKAPEELGYFEKRFASCKAGYGYSASHNCRDLFLAVIDFRLQCRDTEGTVSTFSEDDLTNVSSNQIRWKVGPKVGVTATNGDGFGQIVTVLPKPGRTQKLKLGRGNDFMIINAGEAKRLVIPRSWCE